MPDQETGEDSPFSDMVQEGHLYFPRAKVEILKQGHRVRPITLIAA